MSSQPDYSVKLKRSMALVFDLTVWYLLYILIVFLLFVVTKGIPTISGNLLYYKEHIESVITSGAFMIVYVGSLLCYEIAGTILNNGKSLSKRIFNLRILHGKNDIYSLVLRGVIKIVILNPYGIIAYLCNQMIPFISANIYGNVMLLMLAGNTGAVLFSRKGKSIHDMLSHTCVISDQ